MRGISQGRLQTLITVFGAALIMTAAIYAPGCGTTLPMKLRIGAYPSEITTPIAVASEKGFFISNGLETTRSSGISKPQPSEEERQRGTEGEKEEPERKRIR